MTTPAPNSPPGPLHGVSVVEHGEGVSSLFCARTLADLGAEVIKVERPEGDPSRSQGPFPSDEPGPEVSGRHLVLNTNKLSVTLDAATSTGQWLLASLVHQADVLVEHGLGPAVERVHSPADGTGLVRVSLTPFGLTGPYRDYRGHDITISAAGGLSYGTGFPDREPLTIPWDQTSYLAGYAAAVAAMMALHARRLTGRGQLVDVAEAEAPAVLLNGYHLPTFIYKGIPGRRWGNRMSLGLFPNCVLPANDGHVCIDTPQLEQYQRFLEILGDQPWFENPRYRNRRAMSEEYPEEAEALIAPWFADRAKAEIFEACRERRVPAVPVKTIGEVAEDEHLKSRSYWTAPEDSPRSPWPYPGPPYRFSDSPWRLRRPAPRLGEHNAEVYCGRLGLSPNDLAALRRGCVI